MTPPEQSADKLADRLADAAEAVLRHGHPLGHYGTTFDINKELQQALDAYREAKSAAPKVAITDTQRLEVKHIYKISSRLITIWHGDAYGKLVSTSEIRSLDGRKLDEPTISEKLGYFGIEYPPEKTKKPTTIHKG